MACETQGLIWGSHFQAFCFSWMRLWVCVVRTVVGLPCPGAPCWFRPRVMEWGLHSRKRQTYLSGFNHRFRFPSSFLSLLSFFFSLSAASDILLLFRFTLLNQNMTQTGDGRYPYAPWGPLAVGNVFANRNIARNPGDRETCW